MYPNKRAVMKLLLQHRADPNATDERGENLLMDLVSLPALQGKEEIARLLLDHGLDVHARCRSGGTGLHKACFVGDLRIVELLIPRGARIDELNEYGETPLRSLMNGGDCRTCIQSHRQEIGRLLIAQGADVNTTDRRGRTVLMSACFLGYLDIARMLLERGADPNRQDSTGSALMEAARGGHANVVKLLLQYDANVHAIGSGKETALFKAAYYGHAEAAEILLSNGADLHARDSRGNTPLLHAASRGHTKVVELLLDRGANVDDRNHEDWNALMQTCVPGRAETATLLVGRGSQINVRGKEAGATPLMIACRFHSVEIVELLLRNGADVHFKDTHDGTAWK